MSKSVVEQAFADHIESAPAPEVHITTITDPAHLEALSALIKGEK